MTHLNKIVNFNFGGDIKIGNQFDYGINAGVDHIVKIKTPGKTVIVMDPSAYAYAGTQNFTRTYFKERKIIFLPAGQEQVTQSGKQLSILSYELSCPVIVAVGKIQFILSPAYTLPENVVTASEQVNGPAKPSHLFWFSAAVRLTL